MVLEKEIPKKEGVLTNAYSAATFRLDKKGRQADKVSKLEMSRRLSLFPQQCILHFSPTLWSPLH
jgi:hypothetical protein